MRYVMNCFKKIESLTTTLMNEELKQLLENWEEETQNVIRAYAGNECTVQYAVRRVGYILELKERAAREDQREKDAKIARTMDTCCQYGLSENGCNFLTSQKILNQNSQP